MKNEDTFKKYLFFMLCSAIIVGTATYYFNITDKKKNTSTIIIDNTTETIPQETTTSESKPNSIKTTVPKRDNIIPPPQSTTAEIMLDINSASAAELMQLSGIGEKTAGEIIRYREEHGRFNNKEEIMNVKGIGPKIFDDIKDKIYVIDPVYEIITATADREENTEQTEHIPTLDELAPIDINTADAEILMLLPHVDEETAERIIDFRDKNGGFSNEYELLMIDGLTRNEVSDILQYIEIKKTT